MFGLGDDQQPLFNEPLPERREPALVDPPHHAPAPAPAAGMSTVAMLALGVAVLGGAWLLWRYR